jgi:membrane-associated phospholipid phosphatase
MSAPPMVREGPSRTRWMGNNIAIALSRLVRPVRGGAKPIWRAVARVTAGAVIAIAVLLLVMVFIDIPAIHAAKQSPAWLVDVFQIVTRLGLSGWFLIPLGLALLLIALVTSPSLTRVSQLVLATVSVRLGFLFLAIALPGVVVTVAKRLIGRARPIVGGEDPFLYEFFFWRPEYASFPSGHATNAFAVAVAFGALWPRLRPLLWTYAVLIALSRVIVTAHHPSDVIAGAICGTIGALLVRDWFAARRLGFVICADGTVEPLPGPSWGRLKRVARNLSGQ